ncbi:hypothetical protein SRHO_G00200990 [Serrasalmus rhombeus]
MQIWPKTVGVRDIRPRRTLVAPESLVSSTKRGHDGEVGKTRYAFLLQERLKVGFPIRAAPPALTSKTASRETAGRVPAVLNGVGVKVRNMAELERPGRSVRKTYSHLSVTTLSGSDRAAVRSTVFRVC